MTLLHHRLNVWPIVLLLIGLTFAACKKDPAPDVDPGLTVVNYDDNNQDAPTLPAGTFEAGVRFPASRMAEFNGAKLDQIQYYIRDVPRSAELRVYTLSNGDAPKDLRYSVNITAEIAEGSWMTHTLSTPLTLDGQDLWVAIYFSTVQSQRTIGCDPGPAVTNGDWLWDQADATWLPLRQRSAVDINWNIRALVRK